MIPRAALLACLKEQVPWMEKSDVQGGGPCPCAVAVVPQSEFASPRSSPASRRSDVQFHGQL